MRSTQGQYPPGQQVGAASNVPFYASGISVPEIRQPTAEEMIRKVVADVKAEKEKEKAQGDKINPEDYNIPKCDLHPKKLSPTCRKCKKIKEQIEEIEKKKKAEKEKFNPEHRLKEIFKESGPAVEEHHKNKKHFNMPMAMWGDSSTYNMNELLRNNIKNSPYFNELFAMRTIPEIIDELTKKATHAEPWLPGHVGIPSTFFCCLYRLLTMRLTESQVRELVEYNGNAYVRCAGFLFLRYVCNPEHLWDWFGKYILDEEEVVPTANPDVIMSIGEFIENLLTDMNYHNTIFPRIPVLNDREIKKNILIAREKRERKRKNIEHIHDFVKGAEILALSAEDEDWHEATVQRIEGKKIRVKFTNLKEQKDDADFTLELLSKQFQGEDVFVGGGEVLLDLGEVMTPEDTREYLKKLGGIEEEEEEKDDKMEEEIPERNEEKHDGRRRKEERRRKSSPSSSSSSSRSSSREKRSRRKRHNKRKDERRRKHRSSSSDSSNSDSSDDSSRDRSRRKRKGKDDKDSRKRRDKEKERERKRDKDRERTRKEESSRSSSKNEPKEERKVKKEKEKEKERKKTEVKAQDKGDKYMEKVRQMEIESAAAKSKSDYAARPASYKTSLSSQVARGKHGRSRSPKKEVIKVQQDGGRRRDEEDEKDAGTGKSQPSAEALEKLRKLRAQYGDASRSGGGDYKSNKDYDEGPDLLRLG